MHSRTSITLAVAALIANANAKGAGDLPRSISQLSKMFRVSCGTVKKALDMLRADGLLAGNAALLSAPQRKADSVGSHGALYSALSMAIQTGEYAPGAALSKISSLAALHHASSVSVCRVLARMKGENFVHKSGKKWIAGPQPAGPGGARTSTRHDPPVALILSANAEGWHSFNQDAPVSAFASAFHREMDGAGIRTLAAFAHATEIPGHALVTGRDAVMETIRQAGGRYAGAVVFIQPWEMPDAAEWFGMLAATGRPSVYFDSTDLGARFDRRGLALGKNHFRCHLDEKGAVRECLDALAARGHAKIAVPVFSDPGFAWIARRAANIRQASRSSGSALVAHCVKHREAFWEFAEWKKIASFAAAFERHPREPAGAEDRAIYRKQTTLEIASSIMPRLARLLTDVQPTAWVAPNDRFAREYYLWLKSLGVRIPEDLSMISFDNQTNARFFPLSSIDLGYHALGYKAAHLIIGDMHIPAGRHGNIPGPCRLIDRGSLSAPRAGGLHIGRI
jgi:DNA-binding LacI/PurR family transcriptional regulator/DNA-binding transcriptional regulator YhcF (GntR family)